VIHSKRSGRTEGDRRSRRWPGKGSSRHAGWRRDIFGGAQTYARKLRHTDLRTVGPVFRKNDAAAGGRWRGVERDPDLPANSCFLWHARFRRRQGARRTFYRDAAAGQCRPTHSQIAPPWDEGNISVSGELSQLTETDAGASRDARRSG